MSEVSNELTWRFGIEENFDEFNFSDVDECVKEDCLYIPYFLWAAISTGFAIVAVVLVTYGEPVAAGSGIPQVKCYLNGINVLRLNRLKTLIVKALGVTCSALGGLAVGKVTFPPFQ